MNLNLMMVEDSMDRSDHGLILHGWLRSLTNTSTRISPPSNCNLFQIAHGLCGSCLPSPAFSKIVLLIGASMLYFCQVEVPDGNQHGQTVSERKSLCTDFHALTRRSCFDFQTFALSVSNLNIGCIVCTCYQLFWCPKVVIFDCGFIIPVPNSQPNSVLSQSLNEVTFCTEMI